jgi:hypothetical protein
LKLDSVGFLSNVATLLGGAVWLESSRLAATATKFEANTAGIADGLTGRSYCDSPGVTCCDYRWGEYGECERCDEYANARACGENELCEGGEHDCRASCFNATAGGGRAVVIEKTSIALFHSSTFGANQTIYGKWPTKSRSFLTCFYRLFLLDPNTTTGAEDKYPNAAVLNKCSPVHANQSSCVDDNSEDAWLSNYTCSELHSFDWCEVGQEYSVETIRRCCSSCTGNWQANQVGDRQNWSQQLLYLRLTNGFSV